MPFETVYSSPEGVIARQLGENDPQNLGLTWKIRRDYSCEILLPLTCYDVGRPENLIPKLDRYDHTRKFVQLLESQGLGYSSPRVVDLNLVLQVHIAVASIYMQLLALATDEQAFYYKVRLLNCWRTIPFMDVAQVLNTFESHGVPMVLEDTLTAPSGYDPDSFARIEPPTSDGAIPQGIEASIIQGICAFIQSAVAFGVPTSLSDVPGKDDAQLYQDYFDAGNRAKENAKALQE